MRKIKATHGSIPTYYKFGRAYEMRYGRKYRGWLYTLEKPLSDAEKNALLSDHDNISFWYSRAAYAPEQAHNAIFLSDINFKKEVTQ